MNNLSMDKCAICPRSCGVDRRAGQLGYCRAPFNPVVYSYMAHHGEEPPISGCRGSGTIFFSHCNMKCVYCQNYSFSQLDEGNVISVVKLSGIMLSLQESGCHNINLVSPTHFVPQIISALEIARDKGLNIPIVYNTGGYEKPETLRSLAGIIDIYLTDIRYSRNDMAAKYSDAPNYADYNRPAVIEMQKQAGDLDIDKDGLAKRGLIIRLLVLPNGISGTEDSLKFIKKDVSQNTYISLMSQYNPLYKAAGYKELSKPVTAYGYKNVVDACRDLGLNNGWTQKIPDQAGGDEFLGTNIKPRI